METLFSLFVVLFIGIVFARVVMGFMSAGVPSDRLKGAAHLLEFEHRNEGLRQVGPEIAGRRNGYEVTVGAAYFNNAISTRYEIRYRRVNKPHFLLRTRKSWAESSSNFAQTDLPQLRLDEPAFASRVQVFGSDASAILDYLDAPRVEEIDRLLQECRLIEVSNESLKVYSHTGPAEDPSEIVVSIDELIATAGVLMPRSPVDS